MPLGSATGVGQGTDLKDTEDVKDYMENLGAEYRFGCYKERDPAACHLLGDFLEGIKRDFGKAFKIYHTNCLEHKHGHSCHKAAGYKCLGKQTDKNVDEAYDLFRQGCELGHYPSCLNAGIFDANTLKSKSYERTPDPVSASVLYKKACEKGGVAEACHRYGALFIKGIKGKIEKNMEEAFAYSLKACELGNLGGCVNVSIMYGKGDGVEKNQEAAKQYANIAHEMRNDLKEHEARLQEQKNSG